MKDEGKTRAQLIAVLAALRHQVEPALRHSVLTKSQRAAWAFLESAAQGVVAVDSDGRIVLVNAKTEEMFGCCLR